MIQELLEDFVPEPWTKKVDFSKAENLSSSFIAEGFKLRESDLIWKLPLEGSEVYLFLLLEFQSTPNRWMAFRVLQYIIDLYDKLLKQDAKSRIKKLPAVFPLVLYNGKRKWNSAESMEELIDPVIPIEFVPKFRYFKLAENEVSNETLEGMNSLVSFLFQIENLSLEETEARAKQLVRKLQGKDKEDSLTIAEWLAYHFNDDSHPLSLEMDLSKEVGGMLAEKIREAKREVAKKARLEGRQEGRQEGKDEGQRETLHDVARRMKNQGLQFTIIVAVTGLSEDEISGL